MQTKTTHPPIPVNLFAFFAFLLLFFLVPAHCLASPNEVIRVHVSPEGNDAWSGSTAETNAAGTDGPLRTLSAARDRIRQIRAESPVDTGVIVYLRGGKYFLNQPLTLTKEDGGTEKAPVVYTAYKCEPVHLIAGREVPNFEPVSNPEVLNRLGQEARKSVLQADLKALGITDFGKLTTRGFGRPVLPAGLELFFNNQPMTIARWPNTGWAMIDKTPGGPKGGRFTYTENRPSTWAASEDIWVHGFWTHDWADSYERVKSINPATKTIETHPPHGVYGYLPKHRYYILNVLEELDRPGEWYLDRSSGMLYFWPPEPIKKSAPPVVSLVENILSLKDCSWVSFRGMTFEYTRGTAVRINGDTGNTIENCTLRNLGNRAVQIGGGTKNGVRSCTIYNTGDGGIALSGGNTSTLEPAGHFAENNHIHHYNRWCLTYRPAIGISGVGNRISRNRIHDGPHNAIQLGGNDHLIEYNEIYNVCTESDDVGAFYAGRSWVSRGTVIQYNYFHHIHSAADRYRHGSRVVYLDDAASGFTIRGNIFYKAGSLCAINIGGGRDNLVENNIFIDCKKGVLIDTRGVGWAKGHIAKGGGWKMYEKLEKVKFNQPPYSIRYPKLATILEETPAEPRGNALNRNLAVRTQLLSMPKSHQHLLAHRDNWSTDTDPGFTDAAKENFQLKETSEVFQQIPNFQNIPTQKIGPNFQSKETD